MSLLGMLKRPQIPLKDQTLLAFTCRGAPIVGKPGGGTLGLTFGDATMNVAVFGGTGTGKTAGVLLPAVDRLASAGCAGLILDVKGDYASLMREEYPEKLHIVGPAKDGNPTNLIAGMSTSKLRTLLRALVASGDPKSDQWAFYGIESALLVHRAVNTLEGRDCTLADLYDWLNEPVAFCAYVRERLLGKPTLPAGFELLMHHLHETANGGDAFTILHAGGWNGKLERYTEDHQEAQYSWRLQTLLMALRPFAEDPAIRRALCSGEAPAFDDLIYHQRKIVVLEMPATRYGQAAFTASQILRLQFQAAVKNFDLQVREELGFGVDAFSFLLADEYQQYIAAGAKASDGLGDDNTWFDTSRSYAHINIVATQSITSLVAQGHDERAVEAVIQNCRNVLILATTDERTLAYAETLAGTDKRRDVVQALVHPHTRGAGFFYSGTASLSDGGALAGLVATGAVAKHPHMGAHLRFTANRPGEFEREGDPAVAGEDAAIPNPFYVAEAQAAVEAVEPKVVDDQLAGGLETLLSSAEGGADVFGEPPEKRAMLPTIPRQKMPPRVYLVVPYGRMSDGLIDFRVILGGKIPGVQIEQVHFKMPAPKKGTAAPGYAFVLAEALGRIELAIEKERAKHVRQDRTIVVAIVRGGGETASDQFLPYNEPMAAARIRKLRAKGVIVVTGIGHAKDRFRVDAAADHPETTPTQAAHRAAAVLAADSPEDAPECSMADEFLSVFGAPGDADDTIEGGE